MVKTYAIYCILNKVNDKKYIGSSMWIEKRLTSHKNMLRRNDHHNIYLQRAWNKYGESNFEFIILEQFLFRDEKYLRKREEILIKENNSLYCNWGYNINERTDVINVKTRPVFKFDLQGNYICRFDSIIDAQIDVGLKSPSTIRAVCNGEFHYAKGFTYRYCDQFKDDEIPNLDIDIKVNQKRDNIYNYNKKYDFANENLDHFKIYIYSLKGDLLLISNNQKEICEKYDIKVVYLRSRLKENNRLINSENMTLRSVNGIIPIKFKPEDAPESIKTGCQFLEKINPQTMEVEKEYEYLKGTPEVMKELNIKKHTLHSHIRTNRILQGYLYRYKTY